MAKRQTEAISIERSSGTVFVELSLPGADELDTKRQLAVAINRALDSRGLTRASAAKVLSINQPRISALNQYKLEGFSVEHLMGFLAALGIHVEIRIRPPKRPSTTPGRMLVEAA